MDRRKYPPSFVYKSRQLRRSCASTGKFNIVNLVHFGVACWRGGLCLNDTLIRCTASFRNPKTSASDIARCTRDDNEPRASYAVLMTFKYFAYGSNMLSTRLLARCKSAERLCVAQARGFRVEFSKKSKDGSGKATLAKAASAHCTEGVLFEIDISERDALDRFEEVGIGYDRIDDFRVETDAGPVVATTYMAKTNVRSLRPYDWYLALVIAGAVEHSICNSYVEILRANDYVPDPVQDRLTRGAGVIALQAAGYPDFRALLGVSTSGAAILTGGS